MSNIDKYKVWLGIAIRYLIGIFIIAWLWKTDLIEPAILKKINLQVALMGAVLVCAQLTLAGWRAQILLAEHNIYVGLWRCISYNSVGIFYSLFFPGGMSGDLARAYCFWRAYPAASKSALFGSLFIDRLLGTVAMLFMGLIAGTFLISNLGLQRFVLYGWLIFFIAGFAYFILMQMHRNHNKKTDGIVPRMARFTEKIDLKSYSAKAIGISSAISLAGHGCAVLIIYIISSLMDSELNLSAVITVAPLGLLANALPLTPGGIGVGENGFEFLYSMMGGRNGGNSFMASRVFLFSPAVLGMLTLCFSAIKVNMSVVSKMSKK
jgi:uncharacterized protein (TIRG00374 family)